MDLIKQCRLPPSVIKKLGLTFPKTKTNKKYGNVPYDYRGEGNIVNLDNASEENAQICTASGHKIPVFVDEQFFETDGNSKSLNSNHSDNKRRKRKSYIDKEMRRRMDLKIEEKMIGEPSESDEVC